MPMDPLETLFDNSWRRFMARFWVLVWLFLAPAVFLIAGQLLTARSETGAAGNLTAAGIAAAANANVLSGTAVAGAILSLIGTVLSVIAIIAMINALAHGTGIAASARVGLQLFWPALWLGVLNIVAVAGGVALAIIPGIVIGLSLVFANYSLVVENRRGIAAITQSRAYVAGRWWAVFVRILIAGAIFLGGVLLIYSPLLLMFGSAVGAVAYLTVVVLFSAWNASYTYEMFENLRRLAAAPAGASAQAPGAALKPDGLLRACLAVGVVVLAFILIFVFASGFGGAV